MKYDVIIIGAGASGLMALNELSSAGYNCCIIEAAPIPGGRINTIEEKGFDHPVETGAEFIHGKLPLTTRLLKDAGIKYQEAEGKMTAVQNGKWLLDEEHDPHWGEFMKELKRLKTDITVRQFLDKFSDEKYRSLRRSIQGFAEGFDLADIDKASMLSLGKEWTHMDQPQFRVIGGYKGLIDYLLQTAPAAIHYSSPAYKIEHEKDKVIVHVSGNRQFESARLIITASPGIMLSGMIEFVPSLDELKDHWKLLGFGSVIKVLLQFKTPFWIDHEKEIGFLLSDQEIPTWWTQYPEQSNLLTGWLGGPGAKARATNTDAELLAISIRCLSTIFNYKPGSLKKELIHHKIICWANQPFSQGGYSYTTLFSKEAISKLSQPVNDTLFFAGEALCTGDSQGTVEAALQSGSEVSQRLIKLR